MINISIIFINYVEILNTQKLLTEIFLIRLFITFEHLFVVGIF